MSEDWREGEWHCICGSGDDGEWHTFMCAASNTPDEVFYSDDTGTSQLDNDQRERDHLIN